MERDSKGYINWNNALQSRIYVVLLVFEILMNKSDFSAIIPEVDHWLEIFNLMLLPSAKLWRFHIPRLVYSTDSI